MNQAEDIETFLFTSESVGEGHPGNSFRKTRYTLQLGSDIL